MDHLLIYWHLYRLITYSKRSFFYGYVSLPEGNLMITTMRVIAIGTMQWQSIDKNTGENNNMIMMPITMTDNDDWWLIIDDIWQMTDDDDDDDDDDKDDDDDDDDDDDYDDTSICCAGVEHTAVVFQILPWHLWGGCRSIPWRSPSWAQRGNSDSVWKKLGCHGSLRYGRYGQF